MASVWDISGFEQGCEHRYARVCVAHMFRTGKRRQVGARGHTCRAGAEDMRGISRGNASAIAGHGGVNSGAIAATTRGGGSRSYRGRRIAGDGPNGPLARGDFIPRRELHRYRRGHQRVGRGPRRGRVGGLCVGYVRSTSSRCRPRLSPELNAAAIASAMRSRAVAIAHSASVCDVDFGQSGCSGSVAEAWKA